jgi:hypothetical protein
MNDGLRKFDNAGGTTTSGPRGGRLARATALAPHSSADRPPTVRRVDKYAR